MPAPVITIVGNSPLTHEAGQPFTDPGATAVDSVDGVLTSSISVSSDVDASAPGSYAIEYSVTNAAGRTTVVTRTVNVVDSDDGCDPDPCANGGVCSDTVGSFECSCGSGWVGTTCQTPRPGTDQCSRAP